MNIQIQHVQLSDESTVYDVIIGDGPAVRIAAVDQWSAQQLAHSIAELIREHSNESATVIETTSQL